MSLWLVYKGIKCYLKYIQKKVVGYFTQAVKNAFPIKTSLIRCRRLDTNSNSMESRRL